MRKSTYLQWKKIKSFVTETGFTFFPLAQKKEESKLKNQLMDSVKDMDCLFQNGHQISKFKSKMKARKKNSPENVTVGKKSTASSRVLLNEDHYWPKALKPIPRPGDARYEYLQKKHG